MPTPYQDPKHEAWDDLTGLMVRWLVMDSHPNDVPSLIALIQENYDELEIGMRHDLEQRFGAILEARGIVRTDWIDPEAN